MKSFLYTLCMPSALLNWSIQCSSVYVCEMYDKIIMLNLCVQVWRPCCTWRAWSWRTGTVNPLQQRDIRRENQCPDWKTWSARYHRSLRDSTGFSKASPCISVTSSLSTSFPFIHNFAFIQETHYRKNTHNTLINSTATHNIEGRRAWVLYLHLRLFQHFRIKKYFLTYLFILKISTAITNNSLILYYYNFLRLSLFLFSRKFNISSKRLTLCVCARVCAFVCRASLALVRTSSRRLKPSQSTRKSSETLVKLMWWKPTAVGSVRPKNLFLLSR